MVGDTKMSAYDEKFFEYQQRGSARSAKRVLPTLLTLLPVNSVLDVGCGVGSWLAEYQRIGVVDITGVDGEYVSHSLLRIPARHFLARDVTRPFALQRTYDLVQCLEVGEHIPHGAAETLVDNIVRHGKHILFSAAVPGQGGKDHINELPLEHWRKLFRSRGYRVFDVIRPAIADQFEIEPWYRYNTVFYAHEDVIDQLSPEIRRREVTAGTPLHDYSPVMYRLRKLVLRPLPVGLVTALATIKEWAWTQRAALSDAASRR